MYPQILESVFRDMAPHAESIDTIATTYPLLPLPYAELADWTDEIAAGLSNVGEHYGYGYPLI
jgi:hypothetical protein